MRHWLLLCFALTGCPATDDQVVNTLTNMGFSEVALAVGRDLGDELPLAAALRDMGVTAERLPAELGRIRNMAEQVATVGGHVALKDQFAALQPLLSGVATESDAARSRLEALVTVLGKGLKPEQAKQVGAAALQMIRSRALDIERMTGRRVLNDNNELIDPAQTLKDLKKLADRKFGTKNTEAKRRAMMNDFTPEVGLAIFRTDFNEVDRVAKASDRGKTAAEAEKFRQSKEGQRIARRLEKERMLRNGSEGLVEVEDAWTDALGPWWAMGAGWAGSKLVDLGASYLGRKLLGSKLLGLGASAAGGVGGAGAATTAAAGALAVPAALGLGAVAVGLGTRYAAGENQKVEAQRAQDRSMAAMLGFDNVEAMKFHRSRMDLDVASPTDEQAAITEALLKQMTQLNATLQNQPAAFAEAMGRKTIKVTQAPDPNASQGN